jgi:hypothetical protein
LIRAAKKLLAEAMPDNATPKEIAAKNGDARRKARGRIDVGALSQPPSVKREAAEEDWGR